MKFPKLFRWTMPLFCLGSIMLASPAEGATYLSDLAGSEWGGYGVSGYWDIGQPFRTGTSPGGYSLDTIGLSMMSAWSGVSDFSVSVYSDAGGQPGTQLASLTGNPDPQLPGLYYYASSGFTLASGTQYWIVAAAFGPANAYYFWEATRDTGYVSSDGWQIPAGNNYAAHDVVQDTWYLGDFETYGRLKFSISATAVPEPGSSAVLVAFGLAVLGWRRFRPQFTGAMG